MIKTKVEFDEGLSLVSMVKAKSKIVKTGHKKKYQNQMAHKQEVTNLLSSKCNCSFVSFFTI